MVSLITKGKKYIMNKSGELNSLLNSFLVFTVGGFGIPNEDHFTANTKLLNDSDTFS